MVPINSYDVADSAHRLLRTSLTSRVTPLCYRRSSGRRGTRRVTAEVRLAHRASTYFSALAGDVATDESDSDFWRTPLLRSRGHVSASLFAVCRSITDRSEIRRQGNRRKIEGPYLGCHARSGFTEVRTTAANDRMLIDGLLNGIDFGVSTFDRYPKLAALLRSLPDERPEAYEDYHDRPYLTRGDADWTFRWSITREPAELIAHVIETDRPYTEILTADYTMVNAITDLAYRSDAGFSHDYADDSGFYDRRDFRVFGQDTTTGIPHDEEFEVSDEQGIVSFSNYHEWPHAGVLSTQAWLARYPY